MRHLEFIEILSDLQNIINCIDKNHHISCLNTVDCIYHVFYQHGSSPLGRKTKGGYFLVYRLNSWNHSEAYHSQEPKQQLTYDVIYNKEVFGPTIKEIFDFVKECKKFGGGKVEYDILLNKIRSFSDFQDVLELL